MKIFDTMKRQKVELETIEPRKVRMYVCGPTVYNLIHIGNARPMIVFDTFRRYLEYKGYDVNYVSNFTDVDDKIIKAANEEGVPSEVISERYIKECKKDMEDMNIKPATVHPQATKEIDGMIAMISKLIENGHAYVAGDGTVYFSVDSDPDYGKLSHKNMDELQSGFREIKVTGEEGKRNPADFVLWKPKKEGEPYWDSPWCKGRPGWHIECSVMSSKYLGETIDIHAGGEDLIFPHHENEIAQSEGASGKPFCNYWMHNAFLNINGKKMSKSEGNFFTVRDILEDYSGEVIRFFLLSGHYRNPINFSDALMEQAKAGLARMENAKENLKHLIANSGGEMTDDEKAALDGYDKYREEFIAAMDDDLNTADAISAIFELVTAINTAVKDGASREFAQKSLDTLMELATVVGLLQQDADDEIDDEIQKLVDERQEARKARNFARADEIRDMLKERGITLKDTPQGVQIIKE